MTQITLKNVCINIVCSDLYNLVIDERPACFVKALKTGTVPFTRFRSQGINLINKMECLHLVSITCS